MKRAALAAGLLAAAAFSTLSCGYHVAGRSSTLPVALHTIAVTPFGNGTVQYRIADRLTSALSRELIQRTRYQVVHDGAQADAVLSGAVVNFFSYPTTFDPNTGRASGVQVVVMMQVHLRDRTGKLLFDRPNFELHERYELSVDPKSYFDESGGALDRVSQDAARGIVSAILENF